MIKIEPDDKVELREILGPLYLSLGQHLGSRKILKVFLSIFLDFLFLFLFINNEEAHDTAVTLHVT